MRRYKDETTITDLHESIIINILIYLPLEFIIRCSCVCKQWANLISQPHFIQPYYTNHSNKRSAPPMQFLLQDRKISNKLFFAELDEASCTTASPPPDFIIPKKLPLYLKFLNDFYPDPSLVSLRICTTCTLTGFIVADAYDARNKVRRGQYHVFNPITSQHFLVKQINKDEFFTQCALVLVRKTNQLKLLSFKVSRYRYLRVDIQTIGTRSWRSIAGSIPFVPEQTRFPTFANGLYHWIGHWERFISSFDAETEVFQRIPTPAAIRDFNCSNLGLLDGFLCICMKSDSRRAVEFWVMSEYGIQESWIKKFALHCECNIDSDRILARNVRQLTLQTLEPIRCLENGEIVVMCRNPFAVCYNPSTRSCKYIKFDDKVCTRYKPFPYVPSLRRVLDTDTECRMLNRRKTRYLQL